MTDLLAELRKHHAAMTGGHWECDERGHSSMGYDLFIAGDDSPTIASGSRGMFEHENDAEGCAALRNALPALIAALERAERVEKALNDHLRECEDCRVYDPESGAYGRRGRECQRCALIRAALKEPTDAR